MSDFLKLAESAARQAGKLIIDSVSSHPDIEKKGKVDLVTDIDRRSEKLIRDIIKAKYPDHSFVAEEGTRSENESEYLWLVDPLDGTTNFAHGLPIFCVSIALCVGA